MTSLRSGNRPKTKPMARCVRITLAYALVALSCGGERVTLRVLMLASPDQIEDFALLPKRITLTPPGGAPIVIPLAGGFATVGAPDLRFVTPVDVLVEAFATTGGSERAEFVGAARGVVLPHTGEVPLNVLVRRRDDFATTLSPMTTTRTRHTATRLADGRVLVAGGYDASGNAQRSAELYDPKTGRFAPTGAMATARAAHAAAALANGVLVVAGGRTLANGGLVRTIEVWEPATQAFRAVDELTVERSELTAVTVDAGDRVVIAGGRGAGGPTAAVEIFDGQTLRLRSTRTLLVARADHAAIALDGGKVLIVGGSSIATTAEVFDASSGIERSAATGPMQAARARASVARSGSGHILVAGDGALVERFEPAGSTFSLAGTLPAPREEAPLGPLAGDAVLVIGGGSAAAPKDDALALGNGGAFFPTVGPLSGPRRGHAVTPLADGTILVTGGGTATAEVYQGL